MCPKHILNAVQSIVCRNMYTNCEYMSLPKPRLQFRYYFITCVFVYAWFVYSLSLSEHTKSHIRIQSTDKLLPLPSIQCPCCAAEISELDTALNENHTIVFIKGYDIRGRDIGNAHARSTFSCCEMCQFMPRCYAFAFNKKGNVCWMKYGVPVVERAAQHVVLGLSSTTMRNVVKKTGLLTGQTSVPLPSVSHKQPQPGVDCEALFGDNALEKWRSMSQTMCSPMSPGASTLLCRIHTHPKLIPSTGPHTLCDGSNILLQLDYVSMSKCVTFRPGYNCATQGLGYPSFRPGAWRADCKLREDVRSRTNRTFSDLVLKSSWTVDHMRSLFSGFDVRAGVLGNSDQHIVAPTLFVVTREHGEHANAFHAITELFAAFQAARTLGIDPSQAQVLLLDGHLPGPFDMLWEKAFSSGGPLLRLHELIAAHKGSAYTITIPHAVFVPPGYGTFWLTGLQAPICSGHMPIVDAFAQYMLERANCAWDSLAPRPNGKIRVVFVSRKPYNIFVTHTYMARQIANEEAAVEALQQLNGIDVHLVDFAQITIQEQMRTVAAADVLIGMHGAGLTHAMWLPPYGGLVEIRVDNSNWHCFANIASWRQLSYTAWVATNTGPKSAVVRNSSGEYVWIDTPSFASSVQKVVKDVRIRSSAG